MSRQVCAYHHLGGRAAAGNPVKVQQPKPSTNSASHTLPDQGIARKGHYGAFLLTEPDVQLDTFSEMASRGFWCLGFRV